MSRGRYPSQNPAQRVKELENELLNKELEIRRLKEELSRYKNRDDQPVAPKLVETPQKTMEEKPEEPKISFWGAKKNPEE